MVWPRGASVLLPTAHLKHAETLPIRWVCFLARRRGPRSQQHRASHRSSGTWARQEDTDLEKTRGPRLIPTQNAAALSVFHSVRRWAGVDSTAPKAPPTSAVWDSDGSSRVGSPSRFGPDVCSVIGRRGGCLWKRVSSRRTGGHSCLVDFLLSLWKLAQ